MSRNELILETMMDGYILADTSGKIIDVNPAYSKLLGYSRQELLKMNIRETRSNVYIDRGRAKGGVEGLPRQNEFVVSSPVPDPPVEVRVSTGDVPAGFGPGAERLPGLVGTGEENLPVGCVEELSLSSIPFSLEEWV